MVEYQFLLCGVEGLYVLPLDDCRAQSRSINITPKGV